MEIAIIKVNGATACVERRKPIPKGLVGGTVSIHYVDPIWNDLNKTVVFQGAVTRDVLNVTETVEIPWETVEKAGKTLYIGVYGSNADGSIVVPTVWTELGMIQGAADPSGDLSAEPTQDVWEQMQAMIGNLGKLETQNKASIVDAVNEAFTQGGTGPSAVKSVNGMFPDENGNVEVDAQSKMLIVTATRNLDDTITASHSSEEVAAFVKSGGVPVVNFAGSWYWYEGSYGSSWQYFVRYLNTYQGLLLQERFRLFLDKSATITFSNDGVFHNFLDEFVEEKGFVKTVNGKAPDENGNVEVDVQSNMLIATALAKIITIGDNAPAVGPTLWFNTAPAGAAGVAMLDLDPEEGSYQVITDIEGDVYGVKNTTVNQGATADSYDFTIL